VHETGSTLTCKQIYDKSVKIANFLTYQGLKQGDVVALIARNSENVAPILFACLTLGLPFNPFPSAMSDHDLKPLIEKTKPKLFFCDSNEVEKVKNVTKKIGCETKIILVDEKVEGFKFVKEIVENNFDVKKFE
jgi:acyl-coenzyme A synthetase/AMP-(fatty) acid ligase